MAVMTTQPSFPFAPVANTRPIGQAVAMTENDEAARSSFTAP